MLEPAADRYAAPVGGVMAPPGAAPAGTRAPPRPRGSRSSSHPTGAPGYSASSRSSGWRHHPPRGGGPVAAPPDPDELPRDRAHRARSSPGTGSAATEGSGTCSAASSSAPVRRSASACRPCASSCVRRGGVLGLLAGYFRGAVDAVLTTVFNVLLSIPALVLALSLVAIFASAQQDVSNGRKSAVIVAALAIVTVPLIGRIARAPTMAWSEREFVKAAEAWAPATCASSARGAAQRAARHGVDRPAGHRGGDRGRGRPGTARRRHHRGAVVGEHDRLRPLRPGSGAPRRGDPLDRHLPHRAGAQLPRRRGAAASTCGTSSRPAPGISFSPRRAPPTPLSAQDQPTGLRPPARGHRPPHRVPHLRRPGAAVDGVSSPSTAADPGYRRRVRVGQVGAEPIDHGPAARGATSCARACRLRRPGAHRAGHQGQRETSGAPRWRWSSRTR